MLREPVDVRKGRETSQAVRLRNLSSIPLAGLQKPPASRGAAAGVGAGRLQAGAGPSAGAVLPAACGPGGGAKCMGFPWAKRPQQS